MRSAWILFLAFFFSWETLADLSGRVVKVSDGDTLTILIDNTQFRVRLESIDAPESKASLKNDLRRQSSTKGLASEALSPTQHPPVAA
jgi:endonuclease YncB( thermonuclease family)